MQLPILMFQAKLSLMHRVILILQILLIIKYEWSPQPEWLPIFWLAEFQAVLTVVGYSSSNSIIVSFNSGSFTQDSITVKGFGVCSVRPIRFFSVSNNITPSAIGGIQSICGASISMLTLSGVPASGVNTQEDYTVYVSGAFGGVSNYKCSLPLGAALVSGQGSNIVIVSFDAEFAGGLISVSNESGCAMLSVWRYFSTDSTVTMGQPAT